MRGPWYTPATIPKWAGFAVLDDEGRDENNTLIVNFAWGNYISKDRPGGEENMIVFAGAQRTGYAPPSRTTFSMSGQVTESDFAFTVHWDGKLASEIRKRVGKGRFHAVVKVRKAAEAR